MTSVAAGSNAKPVRVVTSISISTCTEFITGVASSGLTRDFKQIRNYNHEINLETDIDSL